MAEVTQDDLQEDPFIRAARHVLANGGEVTITLRGKAKPQPESEDDEDWDEED